jgi:hypothetical protein
VKEPDAEAVEQAVGEVFGREAVLVQRHSSLYSSSFLIEDLEIQLSDGKRLHAVFKNVGPDAMLDVAESVRPFFLRDPLREIEVYEKLLAREHMGTPALYGTIVVPSIGRYWLFIEKVPGIELYQVGDFEVWLEVARWLGRFHASDTSDGERAQNAVPRLLHCDPESYRTWLDRAQIRNSTIVEPVAAHYERVIEVLESLPRQWMHGEFYASNILIHERDGRRRICPIDWEMSAIGPGLLDVAALASGKWTAEQRERIVEAYYSAVPESLYPRDLSTAFACCQLQIALQWLGWSSDWTPPPQLANDWQAELTRLCAGEPLQKLLG